MADLTQDVEAFATLAEELSHPGTDRAAALSSHGLDEDAWNALDDAWQDRLWPDEDDADDDASVHLPAVLVAYSEAFARAQQARGGGLLAFDRFVEVARALKRGTDLRTVLSRLGVTLEGYLAAHKHWTAKMIADETLAAQFRRGIR